MRNLFQPWLAASRWRAAHRMAASQTVRSTVNTCRSSSSTTAHQGKTITVTSTVQIPQKENQHTTVPLLSIPLAFCSQSMTCGGISLSEASSTAAASIATASTTLSPSLVTFLQFAPPLACQAVFLSPMVAMKQFAKDGTTGDVSCIPYAAMFANGALWMVYGALKGDLTIIVPNMTGIVFGAYYVKTFAQHAPSGTSMAPYYGGMAAITGSVVAAAACLDTAAAIDIIGMGGCAVVAVMFGGPLGSIKTVIRDKNTNSLPVQFTAAAFINCVCWVSYGYLVIDDVYVWGPNLAGLVASSAQIGLYAKYGLPTSKQSINQ